MANSTWRIRKVIEIPAEARRSRKAAAAVSKVSRQCRRSSPTSICRSTIVSCTSRAWARGELRQYDVSDPFNPVLTGTVTSGRHRHGEAASEACRRAAEWRARRWLRSAGTASASTSRTRSIARGTSSSIPTAFAGGWRRLTPMPNGGMRLDPKLFLETTKLRPHQVHLEGGDASSDSYCFS